MKNSTKIALLVLLLYTSAVFCIPDDYHVINSGQNYGVVDNETPPHAAIISALAAMPTGSFYFWDRGRWVVITAGDYWHYLVFYKTAADESTKALYAQQMRSSVQRNNFIGYS